MTTEMGFPISFRLPGADLDAVDAAAILAHRSRSALLQEAVREWLARRPAWTQGA